MTEQDALNKARELWGSAATIYDRRERNTIFPESNSRSLHRTDKWVGCANFTDYKGNHVYGNGDTWEAAFEDAAKRQAEMVR